MKPPKFESPTTSNGRNEPGWAAPFHITEAPAFGSTAPIALLEALFSALNAPPMTMVRAVVGGQDRVDRAVRDGVQPHGNAPLAGSNVPL